ncbi:MAG: HEAT repeat domain-containing protein [Acidobacteria bacterium]|nr:HEAT repeat domain-containing protein [Acidobacteriota bacterium]
MLVSSAAAASVLFAGALAAVRWPLRRSGAALRHVLCLCALLGAIALPFCIAGLRGRLELKVFRPVDEGRLARSLNPTPPAAARLRETLMRLDQASFREGTAPSAVLAGVLLWLAGCLLCLWRLARSHAELRRILRAAQPVSIPGGPALSPHIAVLCSASLQTPAAVGWRRPLILLPNTMLHWPRQQMEDLLAHEMAHIRRLDWLAQLFVQTACSLYWFHPLAWRVARRAELEQEQACDEVVLRRGADPIGYATTLLRVARFAAGGQPLHHATVTAVPEGHLGLRIQSILRAVPGPPLRLRTLVMLLAGTLAVVALAAAALPSSSARSDVAVIGRDPFFDPADPYRHFESERLLLSTRVAQAPARMRRDDKKAYDLLRSLSGIPPRSPEDLVAERARWCLAQVRRGALLQPLIDRLEDGDWRVRGYAAFCLGAVRARGAVPALSANTRHSIWRVRAMAAFALAEIADPAAVESMQDLLDDPAWQVRMEATEYFGAVRDSRFASRVRAMTRDPHPAVRQAAEQALEKM